MSLPERRYDLAGQVLAEAVTGARRAGLAIDHLVTAAARAAGRALGEQARQAAGDGTLPTDPLEAVSAALAANGYEPRLADGTITLANCPFHDLAVHHRTLVCGLNLDLINGLLEVLSPTGVRARLDPSPGRCCVTLSTLPPDVPPPGTSP